MKLVMTLVVRDEADILDAVLAFHLNSGVDFVIATDHASRDGTTDILQRYAGDGFLHLLREEGAIRQAEWQTRMARLAATEHEADWVLNPDADEFWWPRNGTWKEIFAAVPPRFSKIRGAWRHFAPRPDDDRQFAERMTVRILPHAPTTELHDPFHASSKTAHRADPDVRVVHGGHDAESELGVVARGWYPFEILHFPLRTLDQSRWKFAKRSDAPDDPAVPHTDRAQQAIEAGRWDGMYEEYVVDDAARERGLADGSLVDDTRLRDALRALAGVSELPAEPRYPPPTKDLLRIPPLRADAFEQGAFAEDVHLAQEWESDVRLHRFLESLERRVANLERGLADRVREQLRGRRGGGG